MRCGIATLDDLAARPSRAPLLIDCLFGTGLNRGLEEAVSERLVELSEAAFVTVACDLPSGVSSDDGAILSPIPGLDLTVTFGALKPAHRLMPAMAQMGRVVVADIGVEAASDWFEIGAPDAPRRSIRRGTNIAAGWSIASRARCPARSRLSARAAARGGRGLCPRLDQPGDRQSSVGHRPDRHRRGPRPARRLRSWSGRGWATSRRS